MQRKFSIRNSLPHLLTFIAFIALLTPFLALPSAEKIKAYENGGKGFEWYQNMQFLTLILQGFFYTFLSLKLIQKYQVRLFNNCSDSDKLGLNWLKSLTIGLGSIWILAVFFDDKIIFSSVVVLIFFIGFFGINQMQVFSSYETSKPSLVSQAEPGYEDNVLEVDFSEKSRQQYAKSGLKNDEMTKLHAQLTIIMEQKKLYKMSHLSLIHLSKELQTHPNYLSQVINLKEKQNFHSYVNTLRINEFLNTYSPSDTSQSSFFDAALECGFNSKSTFNKYFKLVTGKTPTEYYAKASGFPEALESNYQK